jgi:hypothetical protein
MVCVLDRAVQHYEEMIVTLPFLFDSPAYWNSRREERGAFRLVRDVSDGSNTECLFNRFDPTTAKNMFGDSQGL